MEGANLYEIYRLAEEDVPGASLRGQSPDNLNVEQLKRWLACRCARRSGKKSELVKRVKEYIRMGLDKDIVDPDNGANIAKKLAALQTSGLDLNVHTNLLLSPEMPTTGWTSNLGDLPFVSFASLYKHNAERPINTILMGTDSDQTEHGSSAGESQDESILSFRGLGKGYRFFKDGHVQDIEYHPLPQTPGLCLVRAKVLPSMVKSKIYTARIFIKDNGEVHTAYCICPAGLAGTCNHIAGLLYALEEFVRLGLREKSKLPCTSKLQVWNRPRGRRVPPSHVVEVAVVKEEFGKCKIRKVRPIFDPRPPNLRLANPEEQLDLFGALQKEHQNQLESDKTGNVARYGSSCLLKLMTPEDDDESGTGSEDEELLADISSDDEMPNPETTAPTVISTIEPYEFYERNIILTEEEAKDLELKTRGQATSIEWHLARRMRSEDIAARKKPDFTPVVRRHLSGHIRGNKATRHGNDHEETALISFTDSCNDIIDVGRTGLVVNPSQSWLGASPDAIVTMANGEKVLVEIKCPYTARDLTVDEAIDKVKGFCMSRTDPILAECDQIVLKKSHRYYYQVQVQLHVCRVTTCYFVVWTFKGTKYIRVTKDDDFLKTVIPKLKKKILF